MDPDLFFVLGLILLALSIPPILGALLEGRAPRAAAILVLVGGGLLAIAINGTPSGYTIGEIPEVFARVVGRYIN